MRSFDTQRTHCTVPLTYTGSRALITALSADLSDVFLELGHVCPLVLYAGEDVREQREQQRDVLGHQLRHHRLTHRLDQDLQQV